MRTHRVCSSQPISSPHGKPLNRIGCIEAGLLTERHQKYLLAEQEQPKTKVLTFSYYYVPRTLQLRRALILNNGDFYKRIFHKLDEIGNNANIGIRFFTM